MDQNLLRQYLSTVYEISTPNGPLRVSLDGDVIDDGHVLDARVRPGALVVRVP